MSKKDSKDSKHKIYGKKLNKTWDSMIQRCNNPNSTSYDRYGSRGILVCEEWRNDFTLFYEWSIENGYEDGLTIDRIDFNGNYEPSNCRWISSNEQNFNKRTNKIIEINGTSKTAREWELEYNLPKNTVSSRYNSGHRGDILLYRGRLTDFGKSKKLDESSVREIDRLLIEGNISQRQIAIMFNVDPTTILKIKKGESWSHITGRKKV